MLLAITIPKTSRGKGARKTAVRSNPDWWCESREARPDHEAVVLYPLAFAQAQPLQIKVFAQPRPALTPQQGHRPHIQPEERVSAWTNTVCRSLGKCRDASDGGSSVSGSGNTLTMTLNVTFMAG